MTSEEIYWASLAGIVFGSVAIGFLLGYAVGENIGWGRAWARVCDDLDEDDDGWVPSDQVFEAEELASDAILEAKELR